VATDVPVFASPLLSQFAISERALMSESLVRYIRNNQVDDFHRVLREHEQEEKDLPSLSTETFEDLDLAGFDFSGLDLTYAEFADCTFSDVRLDDADLEGAYIHGCTFVESPMSGTNFGGAVAESTTFSQCDIDGISLDDAEISDNQWDKCNLTDISLEGASIDRTTFAEGTWDGVECHEVAFTLVTFRAVDLKDVAFEECTAKNCYYVDLRRGADQLPDGFREKTGRRRKM